MKNGAYILVKAPDDYPGKKYRSKYVYEHHLVWWQNTGTLVPDGWCIHHKNENKVDNRFDNLSLKEVGRHVSEHNNERAHGPVVLKCSWCGKQFERAWNHYNGAVKAGQKNFYCSQSHQVSAQHSSVE